MARSAKCWIYYAPTKKWYTPEEALEAFKRWEPMKRRKLLGEDHLEDFKVIDPKAGLRDRIKVLNKISEEIEVFANRIMEYYR
ncbi:MAG TPA: hypothetical protein VD907_06720 [Verrucomicrobiae bacterium]|nr:hypothetical protein [Verrucomicrobiae bacterium]